MLTESKLRAWENTTVVDCSRVCDSSLTVVTSPTRGSTIALSASDISRHTGLHVTLMAFTSRPIHIAATELVLNM